MNKLIFVIVLLLSFGIRAQNTGNMWYFGRYAALDFNSGSPVALTNSAMNIWEGCSSISDESGNLLFYTDGLSVWNKDHQLMPNGTGLYGNPSSSQGALIVKAPGSADMYYIFTTDGVDGFGLYYSEVDMTLDGGLGNINSNKNIFMISFMSEKLTAVLHSNSEDVWVVAHHRGNAKFYSYLVSASGVSSSPVISDIGPSLGISETDLIGYLKASPDGSRMVMANIESDSYIFNFNNATGKLTNPVFLRAGWLGPYGCEFSPSGQVLYLTTGYIPNSEVLQYDLTAANIANSETVVATTGTSGTLAYGAIQLGPDGKIYMAIGDYGYVGVINNPESLGGACNFIQDAVFLNGKESRFGLPNFINTVFTSYQLEIPETEVDFSVSPNPANDYLVLSDELCYSDPVIISDMQGRKVLMVHMTQNKIDISPLASGCYFIHVTVDGVILSKKFYKE